MVVLGVRYEVLAVAARYAVTNLTAKGYVIYFRRPVLDSTLINACVGMHLGWTLVVESVMVYATVCGVL